MIIVSDTSPISNLIIVGHLELLQAIYEKVIIPTGVYDELMMNGADSEVVIAVQQAIWIEIRTATNTELVEQLQNEQELDLGESEAIALAIELNAAQLLIDERLGRIEAVRLGLRVTGVLGILLAAKNRGLIAVVRPVMDALIARANFRISDRLYAEVLQAADE